MRLRLRQLEALHTVAEVGSITRAADELGISQPAVSRLLADLSDQFGFKIFQRRNNILVPTQEVRFLLPEIERLLARMDHISELSENLTARKAGHLKIACLPGFATSHLPAVLVRFLEARPGVTVSLEPDRPERIMEWIIGEQYDCGITDGFLGHPATLSKDLFVKSACILPQGHPLGDKEDITPLDLANERLIHTRRDSQFFQHLSRSFSESGVEISTVVEVRQFNTACRMVSEGLGASVVSIIDAEAFRETGIVIRPFRPEIVHRLSILQPASGPSSPIVLDFVDAFVESLQPFLSTEPS